MFNRLKQIKGFTIPEYAKEKDIPKTRLGMQLPNKFSKKGINIVEEDYKQMREMN